MPHVIHEATTVDGQPRWIRCTNFEGLAEFSGGTTLHLPGTARATCNGAVMPGGFQRLKPDDLVQIEFLNGTKRRLHVGPAIATAEPGRGRPDDFTGVPIEGDALRCPRCRSLYAARTVAQLKQECPVCHAPLRDGDDAPAPAEELL